MSTLVDGLVLSLFPGLDLFGRAFEREGFCVVRGPDVIWGGDAHNFHPPSGLFTGVIGGPPCQVFSRASYIVGTVAVDMVPEFVRICREAQPQWIVMENVVDAIGHPVIPADWWPCILRDWDCGGLTARRRAFWTWPFALPDVPCRPGQPSPSVMASTWKRGKSSSQYVLDKGFLPGDLSANDYGRLQGAMDVAAVLAQYRCSKAFIVHLMGNGVPLAMGGIIARAVKEARLGVASRGEDDDQSH